MQEFLRGRNILRYYETSKTSVSPTLSSAIDSIMWKKRQSSLSQKLEHRPAVETLEQRGILPYHCQSSNEVSSSSADNNNEPTYLYDQEQALSGIGLGKEEKERKKKQIESFLVRRPSKKDLVVMLRKSSTSPTNCMPSNLLAGDADEENYDVDTMSLDEKPSSPSSTTTSPSNSSSSSSMPAFPIFDPMYILLEPHVLEVHNKLENK